MNKIVYLSNCVLPSESANSVHIVNMASALSRQANLELWCRHPIGAKSKSDLNNYYGCETNFKIHSFPFVGGAFATLLTSLVSVLFYFFQRNVVFYSRNPFAAAFCAMFRRAFIYEVHCTPTSKVVDFFEKIIARSNKQIMTVAITQSLKTSYVAHFAAKKIHLENIMVLPDAASDSVAYRNRLDKYSSSGHLKVGYSGGFYEGKGVFEVVLKLAPLLPEVDFYIAGGSADALVARSGPLPKNVKAMGRIKPSKVADFLADMDVLLLPNQEVVRSQGGTDIGKFTSPLKLFEYLAAGKVIVASDLPVLKEILVDQLNCVLCNPNDINDWVLKINEIDLNNRKYIDIKRRAREEFLTKYSWDARALQVVEEIEKHYEIS